MNGNKIVPVLITGDVDFSKHHPPDGKRRAFDQIGQAAKRLAASTTLFLTAHEAQQLDGYPAHLVKAGHEIGCHGLTHGEEEEYSCMPFAMQKKYLTSARDILRDIANADIVSFRAPRVKISPTTYRILVQLRYVADSSVCSQRFDVISSNLLNTGWLSAPRRPYYPSEANAYRRGDLNVLVVPVSALAVPFISSALYVLGLNFMKVLFRVLYFESLVTGKPIVYLYHPYEFAPEIEGARSYDRNLAVHGPRFRRHLYRGDPQAKMDWNFKLWSYMGTFDRTRFMTMKQFAEWTHESQT